MGIPAIVAAGDRGAAKAIYGESKVYLELGGLPLVAGTVLVLQQVPEVAEVWVVGDAERLDAVFAREDVRGRIHKPLHVVAQFRNLYENCWETFRRALPGAGEEGRDPEEADLDREVLYLSADLPFATPQEISTFIARTRAVGCEYGLGLVTAESMQAFLPSGDAGDVGAVGDGGGGQPGIRMASFVLREGRFRQSNLHLACPARLGNRHYIQDMYEHRYQREFWHMLALAWRIVRSEVGGLVVLYYYVLMHLASMADRRGWRRLSDWVRGRIAISRVEEGVGHILGAHFRFIVTEGGGCAVDIDNEADYDAAKARFEEWRAAQRARVEELYGPPALPPSSSRAGSGAPNARPSETESKA